MRELVSIQDGGVFANSREVAAKFGKRHADVLRTIDQLIAQAPELAERNFAFSGYQDETGRSLPAYDLDRDGFALLAMGFTGKSALKWKLRYIEAFNMMEERLRAAPAAHIGIDHDARRELEDLRREVETLKLALPATRRYPSHPERLVMRFIKSREIMPRGVLSRKIDGRLSPEDLDEVCASLQEQGKIEIIRLPSDHTGGRPATIYVAS